MADDYGDDYGDEGEDWEDYGEENASPQEIEEYA